MTNASGNVNLDPDLETKITAAFSELVQNEIGASFSAWKNGQAIVELSAGWCDKEKTIPWTQDTLAPVWSATKGPMAATTLLALHRAGLSEESEVARIWPELPIGNASVGDLLSHQCGLAALDDPPSIFDREAVIKALEKQSPNWSAGNHGYHPRTIGFLADELLRRVDGRSLGDFWLEEIATPNEIDFFVGCPESAHERIATLIPARPGGGGGHPREFYRAFAEPDSLTRRAFGSPRGLSTVSEMNSPKAWLAGFPAMGGVGSASGLAKFYQVLLGPDFADLLPALSTRLSSGIDQIQRVPTSFSFGMMMDPLDDFGKKQRHLFGANASAFGHPGAGGSYGFADPDSGWSFAFVMNHFEANLYPNDSRRALAEIILNS